MIPNTKFDRRCKLSVEVNPDSSGVPQSNLTIPADLTIEFEISRQFLSSSQEATFRIYNLAERTRNLLQKDPYALTEFRAIQFRAGYASFPLPLVFNGFVRSATSYRRGVDVITEISAYDGGLAMANGFTSQTFAAGTSGQQILGVLARSLPRLAGSPIIGDFPGAGTRGNVLFGNTWSVILQQSGGLATIDNGQVKILQPNEAVQAVIPVINSDAGLLGVPRRTPTKVEFEMLFEPRLTVGQIVTLESRFNKLLNGVYKVTGFNHHGTAPSIGPDETGGRVPVVAGPYSSAVSLFFGPDELRVVQGNVVQ